MDNDSRSNRTLQAIVSWSAMIIGISICAYFFYGAGVVGKTGYFDEAVLTHIPTMVGLPAFALASLGLVTLLRTIAGDLEVSFLGFQFKGASGPLIMWILCFLAMTFAIRYTWSSTYNLKGKSAQTESTITR